MSSLLKHVENDFIMESYSDGVILTGKDLIRRSIVIAKQLKKYNTILLCAPNSIEWVEIYLAATSVVSKLILVDSTIEKEALDSIIKKHTPEIVFSSRSDVECLIEKSDETQEKVHDNLVSEADQTNCSVVMYTSGTSGRGKGIIINTDQIVKNVVSSNEKLRISQRDTFFHCVPFAHSMGHLVLLCCLFSKSKMILCDNYATAIHGLLHTDSNITVLPPAVIMKCCNNDAIINKLKKYRAIISGGAPIDQGDYEDIVSKGLKIYNGYGATECVCGIAIADTAKAPLYGVLEPLSWANVFLGSDGEVLVSGDCVCHFYDDGTPIAEDNIYHTRDIGKFDDCGNLFIVCRKDDVIVLSSGYKIIRHELEAKIEELPIVSACSILTFLPEKGLQALVQVAEQVDEKELLEIINQHLLTLEHISEIKIVDDVYNLRGKKKRVYE